MMQPLNFNFRWIVVTVVFVTGTCIGQDASISQEGAEKTLLSDAEKSVNQFNKFDLDAIEEAAKAFLESKTIDERLKYVREPERVGALMKNYYGGKVIQAEGFSQYSRSEVRYIGALLTSMVDTGDFSTFPIAVERVVQGEGEDYKVDWESWVGHCEMSVDELVLQQPKNPVMLRVMVEKEDYYNFSFDDDEKWQSYKLSFRNSEERISGYAKKWSPTEKQLSKQLRGPEIAPFMLKVRYPPEVRNKNQVEIVEVITTGWIPRLDKKTTKEK